MTVLRVAVVGGGVAGLSCANKLSANGFKVIVFDKARSAGGRLAAKSMENNVFDSGAQYFTARDDRFKSFLSRLVVSGKAAAWNGKFGRASNGCVTEHRPSELRYVGVPVMRSIVDELTEYAECLASHRVKQIDQAGNKFFRHS